MSSENLDIAFKAFSEPIADRIGKMSIEEFRSMYLYWMRSLGLTWEDVAGVMRFTVAQAKEDAAMFPNPYREGPAEDLG